VLNIERLVVRVFVQTPTFGLDRSVHPSLNTDGLFQRRGFPLCQESYGFHGGILKATVSSAGLRSRKKERKPNAIGKRIAGNSKPCPSILSTAHHRLLGDRTQGRPLFDEIMDRVPARKFKVIQDGNALKLPGSVEEIEDQESRNTVICRENILESRRWLDHRNRSPKKNSERLKNPISKSQSREIANITTMHIPARQLVATITRAEIPASLPVKICWEFSQEEEVSRWTFPTSSI
jgi:hypothetical protein